MGDKSTKGHANTPAIFANYSRGFVTGRDAWCYNSSKAKLSKNIESTIAFYNSEVQRYHQGHHNVQNMRDVLNMDSTKASWSRGILQDAKKGKYYSFAHTSCRESMYRPFFRRWAYYHKDLNDMTYQLPKIFPMESTLPNKCICVTGIGASGFGVYIADRIVDLGLLSNTQCFPLYLYAPCNDGLWQATNTT